MNSSLPEIATAATLQQLQSLPIGWTSVPSFKEVMLHIPGWLITASSALFGATFWFDLLQKLTQFRGNTGKSSAPPVTPIVVATPCATN